MPKLKSGHISPTHQEDAAITAAATADADAMPMTDAEWEVAKPRGRPKAETTKERITIRLSADVLDRFRAGGPGWQTRIDAALKEWLTGR
jgi:uncharacterized protein (DUF4415 family)